LQIVGQTLDLAVAVDAGESAFGLGNQLLTTKEAVFVVDAGGAGTDGANLQAQGVAEFAGAVVAASDLGDNQDDAVPLQVGVMVTQCQELLNAGEFKVLEIVGVVDEALSVGFVIADADFDFVVGKHSEGRLRRLGESTGADRHPTRFERQLQRRGGTLQNSAESL